MPAEQALQLSPGVGFRGLAASGQVLVYVPAPPALRRYNRAVWLILELAAEGLTHDEIVRQCTGVLGSDAGETARTVSRSIDELAAKGILRQATLPIT